MTFSDELRVWIENHFGKQIVSKSDAQELRNLILGKQKEYLSESTIRRFFHLIPSGKTSRTTLDIFSRYVGFSSYTQFCDFCQNLSKEVVHSNVDKVVLTGFSSKKTISIFEINLIVNRIIQILKNRDIDILEAYFNNNALFELIIANKSISDLFAQTLGPYFTYEYSQLDFIRLLNTKHFIQLILNHYVDVNNKGLEKYYQWLLVNSKSPEQKFFSASILAINSILNNQWEAAKGYYGKIVRPHDLLAPPLEGRIALLDWIFSNDFEALIEHARKFKSEIIYFSLDIIPYLIVTNNKEYLQQWFFHFPDMKENDISWVEKDLMYIMQIAKFIATEKTADLKKILKQEKIYLKSDSLLALAIKITEEVYLLKE